jgi:hypothetical protein
MNDSIALEGLQRVKAVDEVTMTASNPTLSLSPLTSTALMSSSVPLNYPRLVSQQGGRWFYFQAFETERFEFLLNFTTYDGIESSFNFLTSSEKQSGIWHSDSLLTIDDLLDINYDLSNSQRVGSEKSSYSNRIMECIFDPLPPQTRAICEKLLRLLSIDGAVTNDRAQLFDEMCLEFFNPMNLRRLLNTYWKRWHRHCPIIHPPSFDPSQAPAELILAMVLIGACVSKDSQDANYARKLLDCAERLIFELPWLSREIGSNQTDASLTRGTKLRLLQAAIIMCSLQTWEGSDKAKARIRKLRYPYVAQACQELVYSQPGEQIGIGLAATLQHWDEFIIEEQIIRYELIYLFIDKTACHNLDTDVSINSTKSYIFLLDTAFTIFYMTPPCIAISDLDYPFSYPDFCFHACTGDEFFEKMQQFCPSYPTIREMHIRQVIEALFDADNLTVNYSLPELTDLGGFILISGMIHPKSIVITVTDESYCKLFSAIHSIIFCQQIFYFSPSAATNSLFQSLDRWLSLWKKRLNQSQLGLEVRPSIDHGQPAIYTGFVRHSLEYYTLALAKLQIMDRLHNVGQTSHIVDGGKENVKQLILDVKRAWPSRTEAAATGAV